MPAHRTLRGRFVESQAPCSGTGLAGPKRLASGSEAGPSPRATPILAPPPSPGPAAPIAWHTPDVLAFPRRFALPCSALALLCLAPLLTACPADPPPVSSETETDTGEPSCLDTDQAGPDIVISTNEDIQELQLGECIPEKLLISGGTITDLTPLAQVRELGGLELRFNSMLTTLQGLENLARVDTLIITGHPNLSTLPTFSELAQIDHLVITGNAGLADLGSFPALTGLGGRLEISGNDALSDLSGLENLEVINGAFEFWDQAVIEDFTGMEKLVSVGGDFRIEDNPALLTLDGLGATSVGGDLRIVSNEDLSECLVADYIAIVDVGGATIASDNKMDICD